MPELVVRRLLVDMEAPIPRHWCAGDAFRTAMFDALSMSFPVGEQFFIDSVRDGLAALAPAEQERYRREVQGFVGQEATHRRLHGLYNAHLERMGFANQWETRARERLALFKGSDVRHGLAVTAAHEHFTAIFSQYLLRRPHILGTADARLATLWLWHSAEEAEHKTTAFDLYRALGGNEAWRLTWFRRITMNFLYELARQTVLNLRADGTLWQWRTWRGGLAFLFGRDGLARATFAPWREYFRADFHPGRDDSPESREWLVAHSDRYVPVGAAQPGA